MSTTTKKNTITITSSMLTQHMLDVFQVYLRSPRDEHGFAQASPNVWTVLKDLPERLFIKDHATHSIALTEEAWVLVEWLLNEPREGVL